MNMDDFNAHHPLWGSDKVTDKGKLLNILYPVLIFVFFTMVQIRIYIREMVLIPLLT